MPSSPDLLDLARRLSTRTATFNPNDADLRRAVSTAYYALFHTVAAAGAERFMGPGHQASAGYGILYRGFDHRDIRAVCEALLGTTLKERYQRVLRRRAVSQDIRAFASGFLRLQEARHLADYDPLVQFQVTDVASLVDEAALAIDSFDRGDADEKADVLALMMVGARG